MPLMMVIRAGLSAASLGPQSQPRGLGGTKGPLPWNNYTCFEVVPRTGLGWTPLEDSEHISGVRMVTTMIVAMGNPAASPVRP